MEPRQLTDIPQRVDRRQRAHDRHGCCSPPPPSAPVRTQGTGKEAATPQSAQRSRWRRWEEGSGALALPLSPLERSTARANATASAEGVSAAEAQVLRPTTKLPPAMNACKPARLRLDTHPYRHVSGRAHPAACWTCTAEELVATKNQKIARKSRVWIGLQLEEDLTNKAGGLAQPPTPAPSYTYVRRPPAAAAAAPGAATPRG